eukprot:1761083-Rhodomonas_salina.8
MLTPCVVLPGHRATSRMRFQTGGQVRNAVQLCAWCVMSGPDPRQLAFPGGNEHSSASSHPGAWELARCHAVGRSQHIR